MPFFVITSPLVASFAPYQGDRGRNCGLLGRLRHPFRLVRAMQLTDPSALLLALIVAISTEPALPAVETLSPLS